MTGPAEMATAFAEPDSGTASTHDSRNEWSGRIRSAIALVSSTNDPKLTMNGMRFNPSATCDVAGEANTGFTSSSNSTLGAVPARRSATPRVTTAGPGWGINDTPPGTFTLPTSALSAFTARA